jgi:two-component system, OmpR family, KDP operon response regulator KdpE
MRNILVIVNSYLPSEDSGVITQEGYRLNIVNRRNADTGKINIEDYDIIIIQAGQETEEWQLYEQIRSFSSLPIIVISSDATADTCARAIDAGADYFLRKPFGPMELNARIRALLQRKSLKPSAHALA